MKIDFNRVDDLNARMTIVIEPTDYIPKLEENIKSYSKKVNMKGFRAGKTPKTVLTKMYGKGMLEETVSTLLNENLSKYLEEHKIDFFGSPMLADDSAPVDFNPKVREDYTFSFDLGLKPQFELKYHIDTPQEVVTISSDPEEIDQEIERYRRLFGDETPVADGVIESNDRVTLKLTRADGSGEPIETKINLERAEGAAKDLLPGKKIGDIFDMEAEAFYGQSREFVAKNVLHLSDDLAPEDPLQFKAEIVGIGRPQTTELTGEQITKFVGRQIEDEAGFREMLVSREDQENESKNLDLRKMTTRLALLRANPFEIPEGFLLKWVNSQREQKIEAGSREANNLFREAKWSLLLNRISEQASIQVTENDIQRQITNWIVQNVNYMQTDVRKLMKDLYANEYFMSTMKENALEEVVLGHIMPEVNFVEKAGLPKDFEHAFHDLHHELFDHGDHSHAESH